MVDAPGSKVEAAQDSRARFDELRRRTGLLLGPALFLLLLVLPFDGLTPEGQRLAAVMALVIVFWITVPTICSRRGRPTRNGVSPRSLLDGVETVRATRVGHAFLSGLGPAPEPGASPPRPVLFGVCKFGEENRYDKRREGDCFCPDAVQEES